MEKGENLVVDFNHNYLLLEAFPNSCILFLKQNEWWKDKGLEYLHQQLCNCPRYDLAQHTIVVQISDTSNLESSFSNHYKPEDISVYNLADASTEEHQCCADISESELLVLMLDQTFISHIACECVEPDQAKLLPQFVQPDPFINTIGMALKSKFESAGAYNQLYVDSLTTALCTHLLRKYSSHQPRVRNFKGGLSRYNLQQVLEHINAHLHESIKLEHLASLANMSYYHFCNVFKDLVGVPPYHYVLQKRVDKAKHLLKDRNLTIADIALLCGFANQSHFSKYFRKLTGITPKAYRQS